MDLRTYCKDSAKELEQHRANVREYVRKVEGLPPLYRQRLEPFADELEEVGNEIAAEIDRLQRECPSDWQARRRQLDLRFSALKNKMDRALSRLPSEVFIG